MRASQARPDVTRQVAGSLSDLELLWLIAQRDQRSMEELSGRREMQISRFALRLVTDRAMAEGIAAETFCQVVRSAHFEDTSVCEIAARAGAPPNTVKTHMVRARLLMAQLLRDFDLGAEATARRVHQVDVRV
jgi:DNA-directed RNA polymerase specialized sigma24 family protein